jgi:Zn-dependent M16 (insulinase) family peptidase
MDVKFGFELIKEQDIPEINTHARLYRHIDTGAELLSLENDDENKVFGIIFRTPPKNSTGVAHIMEHSVLCGSEKYPVREPFVELKKGSLNTFLNAFTYPDKTCYPVASQNLQDFYNLIDVYMDAVLHPLIPPLVLMQEGWHYELETPEQPLRYKGVVFNEMKGAYSSPDNLLDRYAQQSLFPDTTYGVDSGGDPAEIPELTYEMFRDFHERYYHPSNARIFFYGDDDPDERLSRMQGYLLDYSRREVDSQVAHQTRFHEPRKLTMPFDPGEAQDNLKAMQVENWLLADPFDPERSLGLAILSHILIGTPASPLRKTLIDSGLGEDLAGVGFENDLLQMYFSTGLKGIALENAEKVQELIDSTLRQLAKQGIDPATVAASMNTVEFRLRENNTGSFPRGLSLMLRSLTTWLYGGDPIASLAFEEPLNRIKAHLTHDDPYFENLIREFLLENPHRTILTLKPEPGLNEQFEERERQKLAHLKSEMAPPDIQRVIEQTGELKLRQETPDTLESLATIPSLQLKDIDPKIKTIPIEVRDWKGSQVLFHDLFTNGILYLDLGMDLHVLPQEYLPLVSLFGRALLEMGTQTADFVKLSQIIGSETGGIRSAVFTTLHRDTRQNLAWFFLRGKTTMDRPERLLAILRDILLNVKLDNRERFRQMLLEEKANMETALVPAGHRFVNTRLRSLFDDAGWASEQMGGISYLFFLRKLAEQVESNWPGVLQKLEAMRSALVNRNRMLCNITVDTANWDLFRPDLASFMDSFPDETKERVEWAPLWEAGFEGLTIPTQVNYVGKGADLFKLGYQLNGSVSVITNFLDATWLWEKVRVQGGAYGGFNVFDHRSGVYTYLSYRDPNLLKTIENYNHTGEFLRKLDLSKEELTKSIIGAIGELDAYQLPDAKGYTSMIRYLAGETDDKRQVYRDQVLSTSLADFHAFGDVLSEVSDTGMVVVMGSPDAIRKADEERPGWLKVIKVL